MKVKLFYEVARVLHDGIDKKEDGKENRTKTESEMNRFLSKVRVKQITQSSVLLDENQLIATCISIWYEGYEEHSSEANELIERIRSSKKPKFT